MNVVPMVNNGLQCSFVSLAWPWSGKSLPRGELVGVLGPWTGAQCGQVSCPPATKYLTNLQPEVDILSHSNWLANCSWQAGWLSAYCTKCQSDPPPRQRHLVAKCVSALIT